MFGKGIHGTTGGPPSNCMFYHSPLDRRRPLFDQEVKASTDFQK
jgi:hypothetical protein